MNKLLLFLALCLTYSYANSQQLLWERTVGTPYIHPLEYVTLPDGGFAAVYRVNSINAKLVRFDSLGFEVWSHPFAADLRSATLMNAMLKVVPGGLIAGLQKWDSDTIRVALVKVNWQGDEVWTKLVPTGRHGNSACDMYIKSANEYILMVAGSNNQTLGDGGGFKFIVISTDSSGNTNWRKTYLDPLQGIEVPRNIIQYRPNGFMFTGSIGLNGAFPRVIKTDQEGNVIQNETLTIPDAPAGYATQWGNFIQASDGNVVFTGFNIDNNWSDRFLLVSKVDTILNVLWTITHNEPGGTMGNSNVLEMADSTILLVSQHHDNNRIILLKISQQGQILDTTYVPVTNQTHATSLMNAFLLPDSSLIFGGKDFLAKIGNVGLPMQPTVFPPPVGLPEHVTKAGTYLGFAYPNPAENTVTVPYNLPTGINKATLRIAEMATGRLVREVQLNLKAEQVQVDLTHISSGLYTYTLLLDGVPNATKKLVVIK